MPHPEDHPEALSYFAGIPPELRQLADDLTVRTYARGTVIIAEQAACRHLYFLKRGLVKLCFTTGEGKEIILRFFQEGEVFTSLDSFLTQSPARFTAVALEDTEAALLPRQQLEALCAQHHSVETFYRSVLSLASVNMLSRISELMQDDAATRYHRFVAEHARLMQRISLGELAAYLGITQVSLSRIRAAR